MYNGHYKEWDEITCPFPKLNGTTVERSELMNNPILQLSEHVSTMPGFKLIRVKKGPWYDYTASLFCRRDEVE